MEARPEMIKVHSITDNMDSPFVRAQSHGFICHPGRNTDNCRSPLKRFSTLAGLIYGAWVDGARIGRIVAYLALALGVLALGLYWIGKRVHREAVPLRSEIKN